MKKIFISAIFAVLSTASIAQTSNIPYNLHFTAVARNPTTHVAETATIDVRLEVWHSSSSSAFVPDVFAYCEELHTIVPNSFGEFSANFGTDAAVICITGTTLANTAWEQGNLWYIIKYATAGGTFVSIDTGKFTSSTYSFAAHTAEKLVNTGMAPAIGSTLTWNGTDWVAGGAWSNYLFAEERVGAGGAGGTSVSGWQTRTLNNTSASAGTAITRSGNSISLNQTGKYYIKASAPAYRCNGTILNIQDVGTGVDYLYGTNSYVSSGLDNATTAEVEGIFTVTSSPVTFVLKHYTQTGFSTVGLGGTGVPSTNVFSKILVQKIQ